MDREETDGPRLGGYATPQPIMFAAEGWFLRAEAKLRWTGFDWKTGRMDSALTVRLCCTDGHEFEFSYRLTPAEQVQLWDKMDAYCRQQNGQSLEEARAALLQTQAEEGMEIRM